jgi:NAD(P)H-hydrate epimerase
MNMNQVATVNEMRNLERAAVQAGITESQIMEKAGATIASKITSMLKPLSGRKILILVGPGNNGGDGLVIARHLARSGASVDVVLDRARSNDPKIDRAIAEWVRIHHFDRIRLSSLAQTADVIVDCLLGIGSKPPLRGAPLAMLREASVFQAFRIACDVPSGIDATTGAADKNTFQADQTIAAGPVKLGSLTYPARKFVGEIHGTHIGLPEALLETLPGQMITLSSLKTCVPKRPLDAHKGTQGRVLIIAGSAKVRGAAVLACSGALRAGAGYVTLAAIEEVVATAAVLTPSITFELLPSDAGIIAPNVSQRMTDLMYKYSATVLGPGISQGTGISDLVKNILNKTRERRHLVLDADALNALRPIETTVAKSNAGCVLTPHPGELARMLDTTTEAINNDRLAAAHEGARRSDATLVLKGAATIVATPDGKYGIAPQLAPALATAGSGDVLAGIIGSLLAQGMRSFEAILTAVLVHNIAGIQAANQIGVAGTVADDLPRFIPGILASMHS